VLKKWEESVGDKEEETAINDIATRWEEYKNKIGDDTASKLVNHICGETGSTNDQKGKLLRRFLFVEIKGSKLESYLDEVVNVIQKEEQEREGEEEHPKNLQKTDVNFPGKGEEPKSDQWSGKEKLDLVFAWYPEFKKDFELLEKTYFEKNGSFLKWKKSKQSLSEYFGNQRPGSNKWEIIENLFNEQNLKNSYSSNGNAFKGFSKNYEEWLKIKNTP
jgi:hypothetical protein